MFEFSKATWKTDQITMPAVITPQPTGLVISFVFVSSWGSSTAEIQTLKVQDEKGNIADVLIPDKWFLNAEAFPEAIYFTLSKNYQPMTIKLENGLDESGVKDMKIFISETMIWEGEIPKSTETKKEYAIVLPRDHPQFTNNQNNTVHRPRSAFS